MPTPNLSELAQNRRDPYDHGLKLWDSLFELPTKRYVEEYLEADELINAYCYESGFHRWYLYIRSFFSYKSVDEATGSIKYTNLHPTRGWALRQMQREIAYQLWMDGHDLRAQYSRPTFYRYRNQLSKYGINISNAPSSTDEQSNNICLKTLLQSPPAPVPAWAFGTVSYCDPKEMQGINDVRMVQVVTRWGVLYSCWQKSAHKICAAA